MQRVAINRVNIIAGEIPVFYFNEQSTNYEHFWSNGKRSYVYSEKVIHEDENWIVFEIDEESRQYSKIKGDW